MKFGITRWNTVPLNWPDFTYCTKFSTVFGALAASSSMTMSPDDVASLTFCASASGAASRPAHRAASAGRRDQDARVISTSSSGSRLAGVADLRRDRWGQLAQQRELGWNDGIAGLELQCLHVGAARQLNINVAQILLRDGITRLRAQRRFERRTGLVVVAARRVDHRQARV